MPTATLDFTLADVVQRLGDIPLERIPASPAPGTAREEDLFSSPTGEKRLYELVDGVLVEKPMGYYESILAAILIRLLGGYVEEHALGVILGEAGTLRLAPGLVRVPDVASSRGSGFRAGCCPERRCWTWLPIWRWKSSARATPHPK